MSTLAVSASIPAVSDAATSNAGSFAAWSDEKLVAAAKNGQREAFGELCKRHEKRIHRVALRITRNREDAEDSVQDSFISAFVHLNEFDERARFATWLTRIAINAALVKLRKKRNIREVPMDDPSPTAELRPNNTVQDGAPDPEETFGICELQEAVRTAIGRLRPRVRKVVEFRQLQEHSIKQTARLLGISTAAVKARMFHARAILRRMPLLQGVGRSSSAGAD
ncbi:MAG TPA: sigma-70 family RNA polymerase sigma factor [Candidatus Acidoferrum sp.]|jgi:RNA polymerase sigma-70 factor (ECF subfamily)